MSNELTFKQLQTEHREWANRNFGEDIPAHLGFLGVVEEVGELAEQIPDNDHIAELIKALGKLAHATLKSAQGIRTTEPHDEKARDAIADIIIFVADYTSRRGWDLSEIVSETWGQVKQRDWKANPATAIASEGPDFGREDFPYSNEVQQPETDYMDPEFFQGAPDSLTPPGDYIGATDEPEDMPPVHGDDTDYQSPADPSDVGNLGDIPF